jgi:EmrB/QacA subfamily drug resistance transporter
LLLLGGALGDHFGRRRLLVMGTTLFAAASLLCALAPNLGLLLAGRAMQGIGAALLLPNSLALLNAAFSGEERGRAIGIWAAAGAAAAAVAPLLGGWLVDSVGWPAIFYINLPLALGAVALALRFVAESHDPGAGRTDYAGALLATGGLGGLTYALTLCSASGRLTDPALVTLALGIVMLAAFLFVEHRRGPKAMMPLAMFANLCFSGLNLLTFLLYAAFSAAMLLIPYVLITSGGYSPVEAGLAMLPLPILIFAASPVMGALAVRMGPRLPLTAGPLVVAAGMLVARLVEADSTYWTGAFPMITVMAIGMALAVAPLTSTVLGSVDQNHTGIASGFNSQVARIGGLIATALLGAVLASEGEQLFAGFHAAMLVSAAVSAAAALVALTTLGGARMKEEAHA